MAMLETGYENAPGSTGEFNPLHEADPFIGGLARRVRRLARSPLGSMLKRLAPVAARLVAGAIPGVGVIAGPAAAALASALTREQQEQLESALHEISSAQGEMIGETFGETLGEGNGEFGQEIFGEGEMGFGLGESGESEGEGELAWENIAGEGSAEGEMAGLQEGGAAFEHPEHEFGVGHSEAGHQEAALMEQIAYEAATLNNEIAAEALVGSLVPIAMRAARAVAPSVMRATPALAVAMSRFANAARRRRATRQLIRLLPTIAGRTARAIVQATRQGQAVPPHRAVRMMATQTYRVLNTPEVAIHILIRSGRRRYARRPY